MTSQKINLKYILIVGFLALLTGGIILGYWRQIKKESPQESDLINSDEIGDGSELLEPLDTSDWQTYRDEKYGFELRYPFYIKQGEETADLFYIYDYPSGCGSSCQTLNIMIKFGTGENENLLPISEWVNQYVDMAGLKTEDQPINIDGTEGLKRVYKDENNRVIAVFIFFPNKNLKAVHHFETTGAYNIQILEEIISSFHFID